MKNLAQLKILCFVFICFQFITFAQDNRIKIYESKSGNGSSVIVFPNSPEPLMVMAGSTECRVVKTMAMDDWNEMSSETEITTYVFDPKLEHAIQSPRDASSGMASGKRMHKPLRLRNFTLDALEGDAAQAYKVSWNVKSNTGAKMASRTGNSSDGCCSNGVCTVMVSVDKKHTKSGHVTLMK